MRPIAVPLLVLALLTAGCVGAIGDALERNQTGLDGLADPVTRNIVWTTRGPSEPTGQAEEELPVETPAESVGGVFVSYEMAVAEPAGELELTAELPGGDTVQVATVTSTGTRSSTTGWAVLPGFEGGAGEFVFHARADAPAGLQANVTLMPPRAEPQAVAGTSDDPRPVVAIVDTGVNPYHQVFQRPDLATEDLPSRIREAGSGQPPVSLELRRTSDYLGSIRSDAALWTQVPDQRLVHFEGTNVLGYELRDRSLPDLPVLDRSGHGTMTANAAVREAPGALVVMVTADDYDDGVRWAAEQPWIDLISLSWGPVVNAAGAAEPYATGFDTYDATRKAHQAGKIVFAATGNDPTPAQTDTTSGPPWVHAVSGAEPEATGRAVASGNMIDTVANWTQTLAAYDSTDENVTGSGTSFATPTTAGIAARILHEVRQASGHDGASASKALVDGPNRTVTASELRSALNRTAVYWSTTDYEDPRPGPSVPVAPTPWVSMGWGYLDGSRVGPAVDALLGQDDLETSAEAETYMQAQLDTRKAWWNDVQGATPS